MQKYRRKTDIVRAIQWFPDIELPEDHSYSWVCEGSLRCEETRDIFDLDPGDWIVIDDGLQVLSDENFKERYDKI